MNTVVLIGRWTRDVELRYTQGGRAVVNGTVAVNEGRDQADFIPVVIWDKQAEAVANHHGRKGQMVGVTGRLQSRSYTTQDGQRRTVLEVVASRVDFLGSGQAPAATTVEDAPTTDFDDEDVPFD